MSTKTVLAGAVLGLALIGGGAACAASIETSVGATTAGLPADGFATAGGTVSYQSATGSQVNIDPAGTTTYASTPNVLDLPSSSSSISGSVTVPHTCIPSGCTQGVSTASAFATASFAKGSIGVSATGSDLPFIAFNPADDGTTDYTKASADASVDDTLTFTVANATGATVTDIGVKFVTDGAMSIDGALQSSASLDQSLGFGGASVVDDVNLNSTSPSSFSQGGWVSHTDSSAGTGETDFSGVYALQGKTIVVPISLAMDASVEGGSNVGFAHTARIVFSLPANVSFTSGSGLFLSAVPEPGTWIVMMLGMAMAGGAARRRRRAGLSHA